MVLSFSSKNRIVDSFPLPVCKWTRAHFHKTFKGSGANYGRYASKKESYYGYKVHAMTTFERYITDFIHDLIELNKLSACLQSCTFHYF